MMNKSEAFHKLKDIMSVVFNVDPDSVTEYSSPDLIPAWDSLHMINLVVAMEESFNISFSNEEIVEMLNVKLILYHLQAKGIFQ